MAKRPMRWWQHLHDTFLPHERNGLRPHFFAPATTAAFALAFLVFQGAYFATIRYVVPSESFLASVLPAALLDLTNQDRLAAGAPVVTESPTLDRAAELAAQDMASKGYFAHVSPEGQTPWDWLGKVGYSYLYAGENLAVNFSDSDAVEEAWMASPTHHANIVKPQYTQVGFGTAEGEYEGQQTTFVVTFFGTPLPTAAATAPAAVATAEPAAASSAPIIAAAAPPASSSVLGAVAPSAPGSASVFTLALASPTATATSAAAALIALIAALLVLGLVIRRRLPHPQALAGGMALIVLAAGAILLDRSIAGSVVLPSDTQSASAVSALAP